MPLVRLLLVALLLSVPAASIAAAPRVLPEGQTPQDARLAPPKDLDGYFPFTPLQSADAWTVRADYLRKQILVSQGLWPLPTKSPLNAVVHGKVDRGDYTVERAYFESMPGFYVTGSLYRPKDKPGKLPVVLCPHGHWGDGRFHDAGRDAVRRQIVEGAERFEEGGRSPLQARCMQLARMGCVVFHYDMIGYADSQQLSFELVHRFAKQRPEMNTVENWGLYSPPAESRLQSVMGLQTWNSIRAIDFVATLPDVDISRLAVTGASGGGTQTFLLAAVDPRVQVSVPAVMVSTSMQGGCTCENASLLRVGTGNVELAALFAPKPQLCIAADDWTREMATKGFPELAQHYRLLGAEKNVALKALTHFGHNYNYVNRAAMYAFLNKHLKLGLPEPIVEEDYQRLAREEMTVWDAEHSQPPGGADFERQLCRWWHEDNQQQLAALLEKPDPTEYQQTLAQAWSILLDLGPAQNRPAGSDMEYDQSIKEDRGDYFVMAGLLRNKLEQSELPIAFLYPKDWKGTVAVWLSQQGKSGLLVDDGKPTEAASRLLKAGISIVGVDLLYQGEFLANGQPLEQTPVVKNPREFAGYTFGYNRTVFANRVHDVLSVLTYVQEHESQPKQVLLVALDETGPLGLVAGSMSASPVTKLAVDTQGFRFASVLDYRSPQFLPGGAKYQDLPGALALSSAQEIWLAGETAETISQGPGELVTKKSLKLYDGKPEERTSAAIEWLLTK